MRRRKVSKHTSFNDEITDDPALYYFEVSINKDGYWTNSHVKLKLGDLTDRLAVLFPSFDFCFLFGQSSGHCKVRQDGLLINSMNISFGVKATLIRDRIIKDIGEFPGLINIDNLQKINYSDDDEGPF